MPLWANVDLLCLGVGVGVGVWGGWLSPCKEHDTLRPYTLSRRLSLNHIPYTNDLPYNGYHRGNEELQLMKYLYLNAETYHMTP